MSKFRRLFVVAALLFVAACSSTKAPTAPGGGGGGGGTGTGPIPLSFTPDAAHAASATVDAAGGTVTATGADGAAYTLKVPAGAVVGPTDLTVTPLENVAVDGSSAAWQVGVRLEPTGTQFLEAVTLEVHPPASAPVKAAVTLVNANGTVFVPESSSTAGATFSASLWHFSDYLVAPVTDSLLNRAVDAAIGAVHDPALSTDVQDLIGLWGAARSQQLTQAVDRLDQAIAAAIASFEDAQQGNASPTAGTLYDGLAAYHDAVSTGRTNDVSTLQQDVQHVFGTWMRVIDLAYLQTGPDFAKLQSLVGPLAQAIAIAAANPFILQGGSVIDPTSEAQKVIDTQLALADADCDNARFSSGAMELQDLIGGVQLLGLASPSVQQLQDDAASCVPPVVTGFEAPANTAFALADYVPNGKAGTSQQDHQPANAIQGAINLSIHAAASTSESDGVMGLTGVLGGSNDATLSLDGTADAAVAATGDSSCGAGQYGSGGSDQIFVNYDHARGPALVKVTWTGSTTSSGQANASLLGRVEATNVWGTSPSGSVDVHVSGLGWSPAVPDPKGAVAVVIDGRVGAGACSSPAQTGSASVSGQLTIQVLPDPQP